MRLLPAAPRGLLYGTPLCVLALVAPLTAGARETVDRIDHSDHSDHSAHRMIVEPSGVVMNQNRATLPRDCSEISRDYSFRIHAGRKYARDVPGMVFGLSRHELQVEPCARLHVTFVNEDEVRHQWMVHGLPKYLYPAGMFHLEAAGGESVSGTFIVPGDDTTYLIHCDMAQHMEKGMRAQLVVGTGSGDIWGVPHISDEFLRFHYLPSFTVWLSGLILAAGFVLTALWLSKKS